MRRSSSAAFIAFAGALILLAGLAAIWAPAPGSLGPSASPAPPSFGTSAAAESASAAPTPTLAGDPVLVGAGDIASCALDGDATTAALLDGIAGTVFTAGDNAYEDGTADEFRACYDPTWGRHLGRTRPAPGNHDWETDGAAGYLGYFGARATNAEGDTWYSYDLGAWHVVVLDSDCTAVDGCGAGSRQGDWLAADLASSDARCTIAIWHHPRFSSGTHGDDPVVDPFWRALHAAGADVVVNGHDHDYERFAPQDPDGRADPAAGMREFVVGTGGAALRAFGDPVANSLVRASVAHGVLSLTLHPGGYDWRFVSVADAFSDQGAAACH